jgi:hypothetical protein
MSSGTNDRPKVPVMKTTKDAYAALEEHLEASPRLVGSGAAEDLTTSGAAILLEAGPTDALAHVLFDFWSDFEGGPEPQLRMLLAALVRSVEVWRSIPAGGHVDRHVVEALDRMFAAIHAAPARLVGALPSGAEEALVEALLVHVEWLSSSSAPLRRMEMSWVTLTNSMVALWPSTFDRALAPVLEWSPSTWRSGLRYLVCIAYPTTDNPWTDEPCLVWDRFGADDSVTWESTQVARLEEALSAEAVRGFLESIAGHLVGRGDDDARDAANVCEEILVLRLEDDFAARRRILVQKLLTPHPGRFWDDEYG